LAETLTRYFEIAWLHAIPLKDVDGPLLDVFAAVEARCEEVHN